MPGERGATVGQRWAMGRLCQALRIMPQDQSNESRAVLADGSPANAPVVLQAIGGEQRVFAAAGERHVFVYGTLRRGECNDIHRLSPAPRFVGLAQVQGTLYDLGSYPGLRLDGATPVLGEVYAIDPALEPQLDAIEEIRGKPDDEYRKALVTVQVLAGTAPARSKADGQAAEGEPRRAPRIVEALLYEVRVHRIAGAPVIASGDWFRR